MRRTAPVQQNWLPIAGVMLAILSCYGTIVVVSLLALFGTTVAIDGMAWALVIVAFAALAMIGLAGHYRRHRRIAPLALGTSGFLVLIWVMVGVYDNVLEVAAFMALLVAATLDHRMCQGLGERGRTAPGAKAGPGE